MAGMTATDHSAAMIVDRLPEAGADPGAANEDGVTAALARRGGQDQPAARLEGLAPAPGAS